MNFLKVLIALTILILLQLIGEVIVRYFKWPIPGPVVGMVILFICLMIYGQIPKFLETIASGMLLHLSFFFIPAGVGLMQYFDLISSQALPILVVVTLGTIITMAITGLVMEYLLRLFKKQGINE